MYQIYKALKRYKHINKFASISANNEIVYKPGIRMEKFHGFFVFTDLKEATIFTHNYSIANNTCKDNVDYWLFLAETEKEPMPLTYMVDEEYKGFFWQCIEEAGRPPDFLDIWVGCGRVRLAPRNTHVTNDIKLIKPVYSTE